MTAAAAALFRNERREIVSISVLPEKRVRSATGPHPQKNADARTKSLNTSTTHARSSSPRTSKATRKWPASSSDFYSRKCSIPCLEFFNEAVELRERSVPVAFDYSGYSNK